MIRLRASMVTLLIGVVAGATGCTTLSSLRRDLAEQPPKRKERQQQAVAAFAPTNNEETLILASQYLSRLSPSTMYGEVVLAILNPSTRSLGPIYLSQLQGAVMGAPLPLGESLMIAWPQIVGLVAASILLFVAGYIVFQRQEVRA